MVRSRDQTKELTVVSVGGEPSTTVEGYLKRLPLVGVSDPQYAKLFCRQTKALGAYCRKLGRRRGAEIPAENGTIGYESRALTPSKIEG
jgi:hypothetical protein